MQHLVLLQDLAVVMAVAAAVTVLFHLLRQPPVIGYMLAGLIIGPHTPPFPLITDQDNIQALSELGVVMLMFGLGLQFSLRRFRAVGLPALIAGTIEIGLMVWLGYQVGRLFGWGHTDSLFLGAMLLSSSTIIIVKVLNDLDWADQPFAQLAFGILVLDDTFAIAALALLSGIALSGGLTGTEILATAGRIGLFMTVVVVAGLLIVPRLLSLVARRANDEALLITVLGLGFGMALAAVRIGLSAALGAFVIGAVIAETAHGQRIRVMTRPLRHMFSAVFFVSVGLMLEPRLALEHWPVVLVVLLTLMLGKTVTGALGALVAGHDRRTSLRVGISLAQMGEFAFIIAQLGRQLGVTSEVLYPVGVSVAGASALMTPWLIKRSDALADRAERIAPARLRQYLDFYQAWVQRLVERQRQPGPVRTFLRRWALQMLLNVTLLTALLIAAAALARWARPWLTFVPPAAGGPNALILLGTAIVGLPLLIATLRKLRATSMLIAEVAISRDRLGEHAPALRRLVSSTILGGGTAALALYLFLFASALLPAWPILVVLLLIVLGVAVLMWQAFVKVYARAQIALRESLALQPPPPPPAHEPPLRQERVEPPEAH